MRNNSISTNKAFYKSVKGFIYLFAVCLFLFCFIGCAEKKEEHLILNDYANIYYISEASNSFPVQFAYNEKINEIEISDIAFSDKTDFAWEFISEKDENGDLLKIDDYYIYGIIFYFECGKDFIWESFSLNINDSFSKTVNLNIEVKTVDLSHPQDDIRPVSIPYISDFAKEAEWVFLPMDDIVITSVKLMSTLNTENQILFNSVALTDDDIAVAKLDMFYIKILFTEYGLGKKTDKVYLEINYEKDGQDFLYRSDYSIFGNQFELLIEKIRNQ